MYVFTKILNKTTLYLKVEQMFLYHAGYLDRCKRDKDKVGTGKAHEALARCEQRYNSQNSIKSFVITLLLKVRKH